MEPLSAAGLASCIMQMVDFAARVVITATNLHNSSRESLIGHSDLEVTTVKLQAIAHDLSDSLQLSYNEEDKEHQGTLDASIRDLGRQCQRVGSELLAALAKLRGTGERSKWTSLRQALLTVWKQSEVDSLEKRLDGYRQQLTLQLLVSLRVYVRRKVEQNEADAANCENYLAQVHDSKKWQEEVLYFLRHRPIGVELYQPGQASNPPQEHAKQHTKTLVALLRHGLRYHEITERHDRISNPADSTFEWIYSDPAGNAIPWASFRGWLQHGNDAYWITGKAGSGKPTLMKFIHHNQQTEKHLLEWARPARLLRAEFYFWNSGTEIQMSVEGLLRCLLHDIVSRLGPDDEESLRCLFPSRWEVLELFGHSQEPWSSTELLASFRRVSKLDPKKYRIFILIDGLDEYSGDHEALLDVLQSLWQAQHIKICCASRPWVQFRDAFNQSPSLLLHELTKPDIERYVRSKFDAHPALHDLQATNSGTANMLFQEIRDKSSGVFLWVVLAVKSLLSGISGEDKLSDLRGRLHELPRELEALFAKILGSMTQRYRSQGSQLFQIHRAAEGSMDLELLSFADEVDEKRQSSAVCIPISDEERQSRCNTISRRLESRTKGLLECDPNRARHGLTASVQFLHRTVQDYFRQPAVWKNIMSMAGPGFDPHLSLATAHYCIHKATRSPAVLGFYPGPVAFWKHARLCQEHSRDTVINHLDSMEQYLGSLAARDIPAAHWALGTVQSRLLPAAILADIPFWVEATLKREASQNRYIDFMAYLGGVFLIDRFRADIRRVAERALGPANRSAQLFFEQGLAQEAGRGTRKGSLSANLATSFAQQVLATRASSGGVDFTVPLAKAFAARGISGKSLAIGELDGAEELKDLILQHRAMHAVKRGVGESEAPRTDTASKKLRINYRW